jgi:ABC-type cobalamin/Fe3+-siderophores transport system ATPase subunit
MSLRLASLKFKAGRSPGAAPVAIPLSTVVVLVGPNNSGKSLALREIEDWCIGQNRERLVLETAEIHTPETVDAQIDMIRVFESGPPEGHFTTIDHFWLSQHTFRPEEPVRHFQLSVPSLRQSLSTQDNQVIRETLLRLYTVRLDGRTRFALAEPKESGDLQTPPRNHLWALFQDDSSRGRVREMVYDAFRRYFVIDPTAMTSFRIRMSDVEPIDTAEEQALDERARAFHARADLIRDLSDGVQAFTGLVAAVMSLPHRVLLIDEPEAFLHPPLANRLGADLAEVASDRGATLLVSTHSAEFLMGCLQSVPETDIIRLTYEADVATARVLPAQELRTLMLDPLLRSTRALYGVFHRGVVGVEAETDRAFYDEINRRLRDVSRGADETLFINAQNWQTVPRVLRPLRALGVPAAAIVDLDAVCSSGGEWANFYDLMDLTQPERAALGQQRAACALLLRALPDEDGKRAYKTRGIAALAEADKAICREFLDVLADRGVFVVEVGELERWLPALGVEGKKTAWVINAFTALGSDPADAAYVRPDEHDVWRFIDRVASWIADPGRLGMPA